MITGIEKQGKKKKGRPLLCVCDSCGKGRFVPIWWLAERNFVYTKCQKCWAKSGEARFNGGIVIQKGYLKIRDRVNKKYEYLHRKVLGITDPNIIVHHMDENPLNNDPSNLEITDRVKHARMHNESRT